MSALSPRTVGLLLLSFSIGCAGAPAPLPSTAKPGPTEESGHRAPAPEAKATATLLEEAVRLEQEQDLNRAAAALERALRIAPDDPIIWHRLAGLRLEQGEAAQAEHLARKSNLLSEDDSGLEARNWQVIARSRRMRGDEAGALIAETRARQLASDADE